MASIVSTTCAKGRTIPRAITRTTKPAMLTAKNPMIISAKVTSSAPRNGISTAVNNGADSKAASGSSTATVSRSAIVNCRMLHLARQVSNADRNWNGRCRPRKGGPAPFVAARWLTEGLRFLNHEFLGPGGGHGPGQRRLRRLYGGPSAWLFPAICYQFLH